MIYRWKLPGLIPVDAQVAGEELDRIYRKHGSIQPKTVVDENSAEDAPLHGCFEWRDDVAAGLYREVQAKEIIRSITVCVDESVTDKRTRAFVNVKANYEPIAVVLSTPEKTEVMLQSAIRELAAFQAKYHALSELAGVFAEIRKLGAA